MERAVSGHVVPSEHIQHPTSLEDYLSADISVMTSFNLDTLLPFNSALFDVVRNFVLGPVLGKQIEEVVL